MCACLVHMIQLMSPSVKDILTRQETTRMVMDAVNVDRVESLLRMIYHRRRFLRIMEEKRLSTQNGVAVSYYQCCRTLHFTSGYPSYCSRFNANDAAHT